jgi:uncharacterized phage-associated protein
MTSAEDTAVMFRYNPEKTAQAAAHLIGLGGGRLNYMKLIKLLYLADRGSLGKWGRPITGDRFFAMPHGPVLSKVYDQIMAGPDPRVEADPWFRLIRKDNYDVALLSENPPRGDLSQREVNLLCSIFEEFKGMDHWQLRDYCHAELPEWEDPKGSSYPISFEKVLCVLGKTEEEIKAIAKEAAFDDFAQQTLGVA